MLRRIFGFKRDEVTGGWRKLHNEELHSLYSSPNIIRVIKERAMRWAVYVADVLNAYKIVIGKPEDLVPGKDEMKKLKCIFRKHCGRCELDSSGSKKTSGALLWTR
jgi:hypothetical protein